MIQVNISTVKSRLSSYLDQVRGGENVVISDRNHPIAIISPYRGVEGGDKWSARVAELTRRGIIAPGKKRAHPLKIEPRSLSSGIGLLEAVLEERSSGR